MNILKTRTLSRRTMLRGVGTTLGLPLLEAMQPLRAAATAPPLRSVFVFVPGGVNVDAWVPPSDGSNYEPSPTLRALAPVREHVLVLSGLNARDGEVGANGHPLGTAPWLSSAPINDKDRGGYCTDVSVDQLIAAAVGGGTRLPSLELGCDSDSRNMHESNISWRGPASPLGKEFNPRDVYRRLARQLGGIDREKLDEYLESVRSIERRIEFASQHQLKNPPRIQLPESIPANYLDHVHLLCDLLVLALQTDTTRVSTFMFNNEPGRRSWNEIGIRENHHTLAHLDPRSNEGRERLAKLQKIDQAYVEIFVRLLQKLAAVPEGGKSLLDHCQILYGSGLAWGRLHNRQNLPVLLAGGAGGAAKGGRHLRYTGAAFADLHLWMMRNAGVKRDRVADSSAPLKRLG